MTKALIPQQSSDLVAVDTLEDFGKFLRLRTADGDGSPATIRSYYGNAAQFVKWCGEHGLNPATATEDDIAICRRELVAMYEVGTLAVSRTKEQTTFFPVRVFGKLAETCERVKKGAKILVDGKLDISEYINEEGQKKVTFRVLADTYRLL